MLLMQLKKIFSVLNLVNHILQCFGGFNILKSKEKSVKEIGKMSLYVVQFHNTRLLINSTVKSNWQKLHIAMKYIGIFEKDYEHAAKDFTRKRISA